MADQDGTRPTRPTLEPLSPDECRRLLETQPIGRLAFVKQGRPVVLPVNFAVDGDDIVFRTKKGSKLDVAEQAAGTAVAFECDHYEADTQSGWSVLVHGGMHPVLDLTRQSRLDKLGLHLWADDVERRRWLRVEIGELSGRRIVRPDAD